jgi:hypothetical protein
MTGSQNTGCAEHHLFTYLFIATVRRKAKINCEESVLKLHDRALQQNSCLISTYYYCVQFKYI